MTNSAANIVAAAIVCLVLTGCSRAPGLSTHVAAQLAAELANNECDRLYQQRPFSAAQHLAVLRNGFYTWGRMDVAARGGLSALVTFRSDGSNPQVEIFFSHDPCLPPWRLHEPSFEEIPFYPR